MGWFDYFFKKEKSFEENDFRGVWTEEEVSRYVPRIDQRLVMLYEENDLKNPEAIAKFLAEDYLGLTMTDHEVVMRKAAKEGLPAALNFMEDMAISYMDKHLLEMR